MKDDNIWIWYVEVVVSVGGTAPAGRAIGPLTWTLARRLAERWEREHGRQTAKVVDHRPTGVVVVAKLEAA
jgi:hypothetical protein